MDTTQTDFPELNWVFHQSFNGKSETISSERALAAILICEMFVCEIRFLIDFCESWLANS